MSSELVNKKNKPWEYVPLAEHENLIKALELMEKKYAEDMKKKQREAVVAKEEIEKWTKKFGELQDKLEKVEKKIEDLISLDETGIDSESATTLADKDVIEISDDDERNQSESHRGHSNSEYTFFL